MVFKPAYLARLGIQKTFAHGYIQSLVAASQSSSASHNTNFSTFSSNLANYFGKPGSSQPQNAYQPLSFANTGHAGVKLASQHDAHGLESGLAAYYAAWHKHQRAEEKEWHQFQFAKRIGWKPPTTIPEPPVEQQQQHQQAAKQTSVTPQELHTQPAPQSVERPKSTSAVDDIKKNQLAEVKSNESLSRPLDDEAINVKPIGTSPTDVFADISTAVNNTQLSERPESASPVTTASEVPSSDSIDLSSPGRLSTVPSSVENEPYTEHLTALAEDQKYGEIPAVFESMLKSDIKPSASAYNALLLAAINLPRAKNHVVPKVLDVYSDMLRRRVVPDTATYTILIEVLSARALDVSAMQDQLAQKQIRFGGMEHAGGYMLKSDEAEARILAEDDSLSLAIKLFDTAAAVATSHLFPGETYRLLLSACAGQGRVSDMVRIYADMESRNITPPTTIFAPMIKAFASYGDLRSAVECYDEYKALAIAHDEGKIDITRRDEEIYSALVSAYCLCDRLNGGLKFLGRIEDTVQDPDKLLAIREASALQALIPNWLASGSYQDALTHATERMTGSARNEALATICADAADKDNVQVAAKAYKLLITAYKPVITSLPALAMFAMYVRNGDVQSAHEVWERIRVMDPSLDLTEPTVMYAIMMIASDDYGGSLEQVRSVFARIRSHAEASNKAAVNERLDEAIGVIGSYVLKSAPVPSPVTCMALCQLMIENGSVNSSLAEHILAGLGPNEIASFSWADINTLAQIQAGLLIDQTHLDVGHTARFAHLVELLLSGVNVTDAQTSKLIQKALPNLERQDLVARWQDFQFSPAPALASPVQYPGVYATTSTTTVAPLPYEDTYDPYGSSTDFKGSTAIAEILEQTQGRHSAHLNEALIKFKNMRRTGRHPRYITYAKLINAAAKENRLNVANDVLAMARQDVPFVPHSRVVTHGWISILDAMVGACLSMGKRDLASKYHQELLNMGATPSANTFGLYITTLKESTKTFDEATEAVKIFHRAKAEGVEPTSFLYNALIGKLGKARRIDDCLFYFAEMRSKNIRPTSVTYGTIVNALCRVSDHKFAEELFEEMESMPNYKPRPAPYNSLMQYFLTTKRDRSKVLAYYERMRTKRIEPTMHTFKLLIDTHATIEPVDMEAAEAVLNDIRKTGAQPEAVHYASLIHAKGCVQHNLEGARTLFDTVIREGRIPPQASLYQAIFESMVANHDVAATEPLLAQMADHRVDVTAYIANTLIHGWALEKNIDKARAIFDSLGMDKREPSTYEAMTRAYMAVEDHGNAMSVVGEALRRGYPAAVANKICDLVGGGGRALTLQE